MPAALVIAGIGAGVAAIGTGYSIYSGERANKQQKKAYNAETKRANLQEARQKRDAVRQARLSYANAQAAAENQGVSTSSSAQGGQGSIVSQLRDTTSFLDQYGFYSDQASNALGKARSYETASRTASEVAGLGATLFANSANITDTFNKVFKSGG